MLLKKSQITGANFPAAKKSDRRPPNRCGLNHVTVVAERVYLHAMRSPTSLHENRMCSQKKFWSPVQKDFFNSIGQGLLILAPASSFRSSFNSGRNIAPQRTT
jgi:hypothetical protein